LSCFRFPSPWSGRSGSYLLHYNLSVAVWVGLIALAGLDAETGVVMLLYLDQAWDRFKAAGRLATPDDLRAAIIEGAVQRIRPKIMTVCAILFGLLPIMMSPVTQVGADVMKRIAAPMVGGVTTSAILELLLYPTIYSLWRRRHLPEPHSPGARPSHARGGPAPKPPARRYLRIGLLILAGVAAGACLLLHRPQPGRTEMPGGVLGRPFATHAENGLTVNLYGANDALRPSENKVVIEFRDARGEPVDVGVVKFDLDMAMPGMAMHAGSTITPAGEVGRYAATIRPGMAGDWTAQLHYDGPGGSGQMGFTLNVAPP
jgi:hypothetical protein